jgi:hypothetical protein
MFSSRTVYVLKLLQVGGLFFGVRAVDSWARQGSLNRNKTALRYAGFHRYLFASWRVRFSVDPGGFAHLLKIRKVRAHARQRIGESCTRL